MPACPTSVTPRSSPPGDIVRIERPLKSSGEPTYAHDFVVLFVPEALNVGDEIPCLGVTSRIACDPERHVEMRWASRRGGHPDTGFSKPCRTDVTFRHLLVVRAGPTFPLQVEAEFSRRFIRRDHFHAVVALLNAYNRKQLLSRTKPHDTPRPD